MCDQMRYSLRSLCFNIVFFSVMSFMLVSGRIFMSFVRDTRQKYIFGFWSCLSKLLGFLSDKLIGISYHIENEENIPDGPAIFAMRHESVWETLILICKFKKPIFVLKKELLDIPLFGYLARRSNSIPIDRKNGMRSLMEASRKVEQAIAEGHHVIIFPEGTRVANGSHAELKRGISFFYRRNKCPVIPVVHNSGKFWPRRSFLKKSGDISVVFCEPIQPGLSAEDFMEKLNSVFYNEVEKLKHKNVTGTHA